MSQAQIPYGHQDIDDEDIEAVVKILKGDFLTQGPAVDEFEAKLAGFIGVKHAVAVSNGTAGLHIAYLAQGIGPGDAVIVPANTFAATANAALYCGATPVFADIDPNTLCILPSSIARCIQLIERAGLRPAVIAPVHFAGRPCEMETIYRLARDHGMAVIEDAAHAFGAEYGGERGGERRFVGSSDQASMAVFSFHPVKHITTGEGGAVLTAHPELHRRLQMLRTHGITKQVSSFVNLERATQNNIINPWYHEMQSLGLNYRLSDIQAVLGSSQLSRAGQFVERRRQIAAIYDQAFAGHPALTIPPGHAGSARHSYHLYPLRVQFAKLGYTRAGFMNALRERGIGSQVHYIPVCWHPYYESHRDRWLADSLDHAIAFYEAELSIPMFSKMDDVMVRQVIEGILSLAPR